MEQTIPQGREYQMSLVAVGGFCKLKNMYYDNDALPI